MLLNSICAFVFVAEFQAKYDQQDLLGAGGCGSVFAGYRRADGLPVSVHTHTHTHTHTHILKHTLLCGQEVLTKVLFVS